MGKDVRDGGEEVLDGQVGDHERVLLDGDPPIVDGGLHGVLCGLGRDEKGRKRSPRWTYAPGGWEEADGGERREEGENEGIGDDDGDHEVVGPSCKTRVNTRSNLT